MRLNPDFIAIKKHPDSTLATRNMPGLAFVPPPGKHHSPATTP